MRYPGGRCEQTPGSSFVGVKMIDPNDVIPLDSLKLALRITNHDEDGEISRKRASAVAECARFLNSDLPINESGIVPADLVNGVVLMVQADYELDPLQRVTMRMTAQRLWGPYRSKVGI